MSTRFLAISSVFAVLNGAPVIAASLAPDAVLDGGPTLQITSVGSVVAADTTNNLASPVAIGDDLYVVDQTGRILKDSASGFETVFATTDAPAGITLTGRNAVLNIAGRGRDVYVAFTSSTLPSGIVAAPLPADPAYQQFGSSYQVIYSYTRGSDGSLDNPQPVAAFEQANRFHSGGGMLVLEDGDLVFARGDNLGFDRDGLSAPQDDTSSVSRLFLYDKDSGDLSVAAKGVRNVQRLTFSDAGETQIAFADIGATTAEEINVISVSDLRDTSEVENFGWGRAADGNAREGTFYISEGTTAVPGTLAEAIGMAPIPETGFIKPYAQFGREDVTGLFAVSGPVASESSFSTIDVLFGDLVNGELFATLEGTGEVLRDVYRVGLIDDTGAATSLSALAGGERIDVRFFNFADGGAGVLFERQGELYRLQEVASVVPLPASGLLLLGGLGIFLMRRRSQG